MILPPNTVVLRRPTREDEQAFLKDWRAVAYLLDSQP
jgi:hypothetical protein